MTFTELGTPDSLTDFLNANDVCIVAFSATWCGPCKASKPDLEELAQDSPVPIGYVYESDLEDDGFFNTFQNIFLKSGITGFPTYICFKGAAEVQRMNGSDFKQLQEIISAHAPKLQVDNLVATRR